MGHDTPSQTHLPSTQRLSGPHSGLPPPQWQAPSVPHSSPSGAQATHAPPPVPQVTPERGWQTLFRQQLPAQLVPSHTQAPETQRWPYAGLQAGPVPHRQAPAAQLSAVAPQATQTLPPVPQATADGVVQVEPEQQPFGQLDALHPEQAPPLHASPTGHAAQAAPPRPHAVAVSPGRHVVPEQQPAQETLLHTQDPPRHCCPARQTGPVPQAHAPAALHASARTGSQATQAAPPVPQLDSEEG